MNQICRLVAKVPKDIFNSVVEEVNLIDWRNLLIKDTRSSSPVFSTSIANHLRVHKIDKDTPQDIKTLSNIIACVDTKARTLYPNVEKLINWSYSVVDGFELGKVMLVNLRGQGSVVRHIDKGSYFEWYFRFHIPIITNHECKFFGSDASSGVHMSDGQLFQLFNGNLHGVENPNNEDRIHLIIDVASKNKQFTY